MKNQSLRIPHLVSSIFLGVGKFDKNLDYERKKGERRGFCPIDFTSCKKNDAYRKRMTTTRTSARKVDDMGLGESEAHVMKSALTVCGKKYVCKDDKNPRWEEGTEHSSSKCNVDALVAAGVTMGCKDVQSYAAIDTTKACFEGAYPVMTDGTDLFQMRTSSDAPDMTLPLPPLDATWRCKGGVNKTTHFAEPRSTTLGQLMLLPLTSKQDSLEKDAKESAPPTPAKVSPLANDSETSKKCSAPVSQTACNTDLNCPLEDADIVDALLSNTTKIDNNGTVNKFLRKLQGEVSNSIQWTEAKTKTLKSCNGKADMHARLVGLMQSDAVFKESIKKVVKNTSEFHTTLKEVAKGRCVEGRCNNATTVPDIRVVTSPDAVLHVGEDGEFMITNGPESLPKRVPKVVCTVETCGDAVSIAGDPHTNSVRMKRVVDKYRVRMGDSEYLIHNSIHGKDDGDCARRICRNNQTTCPSSLCHLDRNDHCVPK